MSNNLPIRTPNYLPNEEQICLFMGGPLDGRRIMVKTTQERIYCRFTGPVNKNGDGFLEEHTYWKNFFGEGNSMWCVYTSQNFQPGMALQYLLDRYGVDAKAPESLVDAKSPILDAWDLPDPLNLHANRQVAWPSPDKVAGGGPYTLWMWNHADRVDVKIHTADDLGWMFKEVDRYIKDGRDSWVTDVRGNVVVGAACKMCNGRDRLYRITYHNTDYVDFACGKHYTENTSEVLQGAKAATLLRTHEGSPW